MSRKFIIWLALRGTLALLVGSMILACATSTPQVAFQQPQEITTKSVLETCEVVQDQELAEMRGCYDTYSFGMSVTGNLDMASKNFSIATNYNQAMDATQPSRLTVNSTGSQVAFNNGNVSYTAGVGQNSLGTGIMQVVQVAGQNIAVNANMSVTLNIDNAIKLNVPTAASTLPGALKSIVR